MWINELKIAFVTKDIQKIDKLIGSLPKFETLKEMEEAYHIMDQVNTLLNSLKNKSLTDMKKIKSNIVFLKSSIDTNSKSKFNFDV